MGTMSERLGVGVRVVEDNLYLLKDWMSAWGNSWTEFLALPVCGDGGFP